MWTKTQENCVASTKLGIKYDKTAVNGEGLNEKGHLDSQVLKTEIEEVAEDAYIGIKHLKYWKKLGCLGFALFWIT